MCVQTQPSSTLFLTLPIHAFSVIKRKEKKQIIFSHISMVVFLCYTTNCVDIMSSSWFFTYVIILRGTHGVMIIIIINGHSDESSKPG